MSLRSASKGRRVLQGEALQCVCTSDRWAGWSVPLTESTARARMPLQPSGLVLVKEVSLTIIKLSPSLSRSLSASHAKLTWSSSSQEWSYALRTLKALTT